MSTIALELVIIFILILINGILAMSEMALVSARKARLQQRAGAGDGRAQAALALATEPGQFLSTVQIGITMVGILAGAFGGAQVARFLAQQFEGVPVLGRYNAAAGLALVVLAITYLSLVLGELTPKRLALNNPEGIAMLVARPMRALAAAAAPAVWLLDASTRAVLRLLGARPSQEPPVTEEEVKVLIEQGALAGVFEDAERQMVQRIFRLGDLRIGALMTPRPDIIWLDVEDSPEQLLAIAEATPRSYLPVARGSLDELLGIVRTKDVIARAFRGEPLDLPSLVAQPLFVPETARALRALDLFRAARVHLAIVIDEFGGTQGLVTLTDLLEAITGDLPAAADTEEPEAVQRDDGSWLLDGAMAIDDVVDLLRLGDLPEDERGAYDTVGGFVLARLGHIPHRGESFSWHGYRFEVMDMDGRRVDQIMAKVEP